MLKAGDKAPNFKAPIQDGSELELSSYLGQTVALYFYPKDNTPGCTKQACSLRDAWPDLEKEGVVVIGVSSDSTSSHAKFADKFELPFPLVSDPEKEIQNAYGVWALKKFMGKEYMGTVRTTFLIDEQGMIKEVITKPITKDHGNQVLSSLKHT